MSRPQSQPLIYVSIIKCVIGLPCGYAELCIFFPGFTRSEHTNLGSIASISQFSGSELVNQTHGHILIELTFQTALL